MSAMTWEQAVRWYREQPGNEAAIRANYFDLPVRQAVERFAASEEAAEILRLLGPAGGRRILDLGAGNGLASYTFARAGWQVTALEPDESEEVGAGAIRALAAEAGLKIELAELASDRLPFPDASFDAVFARQVLHHVGDVAQTMRDLHRILRPGGTFLATREHVADDAEQIARFRQRHPLHHLYGGENAHPLATYLATARDAGFVLREQWGPLQSVLNFHPGTEAERRRTVALVVAQQFGGLGRLALLSPRLTELQLARATARDCAPGRIFSFLWVKP